METPLFRFLPRIFYIGREKLLYFFRKSLFRIFGIEVTIGGLLFELAIWTAFLIAGFLTFFASYPSAKKKIHKTGDVLSFCMGILFSIAGRNSIWLFLLGITYEKSALWHRTFSGIAVVLIIFHFYSALGYDSWQFWIGLTMMIFVGILVFTSHILRWVNLYRTFLVIHRFSIAIILIMMCIHGAVAGIVGGSLYAFDVLFRYILTARLNGMATVVNAEMKTPDVIELSFYKGEFSYSAGQYMWVKVPCVSCWEAHPFSISSSPHMEKVTMHIKVLGDWTRALAARVKRGKGLNVNFEGPYGNPLIEFESPDRKIFLLIAGGIGATPIISIGNGLIEQKFRGRAFDRLHFWWSFREPDLPLALTSKDEFLMSFSQRVEEFHGSSNSHLPKDLVQVQLFYRGENSSQLSKFEPFIRNERMNLPSLFKEIESEKKSLNSAKVCVVCCGPESLMSEVSSLSRKFGFVYHTETFSY